MRKLSRRKLLGGAAGTAAVLPALHGLVPHRGVHEALAGEPHDPASHRGADHRGMVGRVDPAVNGFDPHHILRDFDEGTLVDGVREWEIVAEDKEIEVAPGVKFAAWAYNGRVPGPTLRAREGERLRINFVNASSHPHTIHFHGIHTAPARRHSGHRRRKHRTRTLVHLRVRRRAVRAPPLPLPLDPARGPHRQGPLRHVHHRPEAGATRRRTSS